MRNSKVTMSAAVVLATGLLALSFASVADGSIYRCHGLDGNLRFQDKPCNASTGTREAQSNKVGDVVPVTPDPPQDGGTPAAEHYARYLDFVSRDRREQNEEEQVRTARLQVRAEADRQNGFLPGGNAAPGPACPTFGPNGECAVPGYDTGDGGGYGLSYGPVFPYGAGGQRRPGYQGPYRAGSNPSANAARVTPPGARVTPEQHGRDVRANILSLAP